MEDDNIHGEGACKDDHDLYWIHGRRIWSSHDSDDNNNHQSFMYWKAEHRHFVSKLYTSKLTNVETK